MSAKVRALSRSVLSFSVLAALVLACFSCQQGDKTASRATTEPNPTREFHLPAKTYVYVDNPWPKVNESADKTTQAVRAMEKKYPYLQKEVSVTIKNLSLEDAIKVVEAAAGGPIPYRLEGSDFVPIKKFTVEDVRASDIIIFLADLADATVDLDERGILFVKR